MMKEYSSLMEIYKNPRTNGIFYQLYLDPDFASIFTILQVKDAQDAHKLDYEYIYNISGLKTPSVMLEFIMKGYIMDDLGDNVITLKGHKVTWDYVLQQIDQDIVNFIIKAHYLQKWTKLVDTLTLDYDTLSPFNIELDESTNRTLGSDTTRRSNYSSNSSGTYTNDNNYTTNDSRNGFNSDKAVPTESSNTLETENNTNTNEQTSENTGTDNYNSTENINRNYTRKGNIGNRSNQQLIEEQRELLNFQLLNVIHNDLDEILTRSMYKGGVI